MTQAGQADSDDKLSDDVVLKVQTRRVRVDIAKGAGKGTTGTAAITSITIQYGKDGSDDKYQGRVQRNADPNLEIIGYFNSGTSSSSGHPAGRAAVVVDNAKDGSGTATISTSSSDRHSVKAGSDDNKVTVTYMAEGTMDGGRVSLQIPDGWGALQELGSAEANHIAVKASSRIVDQDGIDYGADFIVVNLKEFGYGNSIQFVYSKAKAQSGLGIAEFIIESAGSSSGDLTSLLGVPRPADDENADNKEDSPFLLLGHVYQTHDPDDS